MDVTRDIYVQALDELGRWENAKVKARFADGRTQVTFTGWSAEYDQIVPPEGIRERIHPFESELGE